jgi:hypothetical protein
MDKKELQKKLNKPYSTENWQEIVKFVFPNVSLREKPAILNVEARFQDIVESFKQLGDVKLHDGKTLALLELKVKENVNIIRNRVRLNEVVSSVIDTENANGVLSIFEKGTDDYRFTFSARANEFSEEEGEFVTKKTDTKRYTYVLGKNESCKTPAQRFYDLSTNKSKAEIKDIEDAFSVEKLSVTFFNEYKEQYKSLVKYMIETPGIFISIYNKDDKAIRDFVKILLGRIIFIKFVQKKGWMGVDATSKKWIDGDYRFLENGFANFKHQDLFYSTYLEPLFDALDEPNRPNDIFTVTNTRVPYLSGGLFELEDKKTKNINFPAKYFNDLFEFLDRYNFTIDENDTNDHEVGIDPEMLGHIFENLLEDNKDKGAFYTPKEIVRYMCQESLKEYLKTSLENHKQWPTDETEATNFELALHNFVAKKEAGGIIEFEETIARALKDVKICDPAIGSGAFPMGLLNEIFQLVHKLHDANKDKLERVWELQGWQPNLVKQNIIQNSIYGVDIEKGAVDVARLRFWLSLIVDEPEPNALPHLDYKIVVGNSLVSKLDDIIIDIDWNVQNNESNTETDLFGKPKPKQFNVFEVENDEKLKKLLEQISTKQKAVFDPNSDEEKLSFEIRNLKIDILMNHLDALVKTKGVPDKPLGNDKKIKEQTDLWLKTIDWKNKISKLEKLKKQHVETLHFFDWKLDFPEIMNEQVADKVGFDIIIGNPPYVSNKGVDDDLKDYFGYSDDLYNYFFLKGDAILKQKGIFCYITSSTFLTLQSKMNVRELLLKNELLSLVNLGHDVFKTAMVSTAISIYRKHKKVKNTIVIDARGKAKLSEAKSFHINQNEFVQTPNKVIFTPNDFNLEIHKKYSSEIKKLLGSYWDKISTSRNITKFKSDIENYQSNLKSGEITLLGLVTDGGQGLATANNGKFVGVLHSTKEAERTIQTRNIKLKEVNLEYSTKYSIDGLDEYGIRKLFDDIKLKHGRDVFGQGYLYQIVQQDEIADLDKITEEEKANGIFGHKSFVPYDKGDKDGNRWYLETPYYIDWNNTNVKFLKENSGKKGKGMPVLRNPDFYFKEGFCWNDIHTVLIKARYKGISVHDVVGMSLFPILDTLTAKYIVCIINSHFASEYSFEFLNNTSHFQINDARCLPIIVPNKKQLDDFENIFDRAYQVQKEKFSKKITIESAEQKLEMIQHELDEKVNELYFG